MTIFMRVTVLFLLATLSVTGLPLNTVAAANKSAPNVIVITIDTLRADHLGCYGYKRLRTPNIDSLAADGVRFERAYTPVPITLPAHTVIFTGTYPTLNGMHDFSANRLGAQPPTLAALLRDKGYATGAVVASGVLDSRFGLNRGFDFYYDHFDFNRLQESNLDDMERPGNIVADEALSWLSKNYTKRFFLWMHLYDPHYPYRPPAPYGEEYKSHPYDGEIAFADEQVGRVLRFLKEKGLYWRSIVVLAGDHGEGLGEHGERTHGFFIYNSTLHVPLIIHLPENSRTKQSSELVSLADIVPTILQALKLPVPMQVQGKGLLPTLAGKRQEEPRSLYTETFLPRLHFNWSELRAIEMGKYHFIEAPRPELYDLTTDPGELVNLYSQMGGVAAELRSKLHSMIRELTPGEELAEKTGLDPTLMERLKSLGYAGFSGGGDQKERSSDLPDPKDRIQVYELISEGMAASQHGQYQESVQKLTAALATEPNSVPVHYLLGLDYYRLRNFASAIDHFQRVLQTSPDYSLAVYQLGLSYAQAGDMASAIQTLQRALQLDSTNFAAAYNLGAAYMHEGRASEAAAAFRQAITLAPDYATAHIALGEVMLYQGQVDDSLAELRKAVGLAPQDPRVHRALAKALETKGLRSEAEQELRKAGEVNPR
jgi:arylsulfatase A-like enzyme/Flp pilus assembly protein TadD